MLTRCPRCATTFRVTPEQLKARHGRVRCGHCQDVFNALDTLIEAIPQPAHPATSAQASLGEDEQSAVSPPEADDAVAATTATPATPPDDVDAAPEVASPAAKESAEPTEPSGTSEPEPSITPEEESSAIPQLEPLLHEERRPHRSWPWALGGLAMAAILLLQAAIHYRTEISVLYPNAKPMLNALCAPLGCEVSLPRKAELVGIEASNLAPESGSRLALSATLKNRAPFAQQYPDLELTLTDTADKALVRRILAPADYLPPKTDVAAGFAAGTDIAINLAIDAPGLPAAGYQLYLFYP